jgi:hypothetical protein
VGDQLHYPKVASHWPPLGRRIGWRPIPFNRKEQYLGEETQSREYYCKNSHNSFFNSIPLIPQSPLCSLSRVSPQSIGTLSLIEGIQVQISLGALYLNEVWLQVSTKSHFF